MPSSELFKAGDGTGIQLVPAPYCQYCSMPLGDDFGYLGICYRCNRRFKEMGKEDPKKILYSPYSFSRAVAAGLYIKDDPQKGSTGRLISGLKAQGLFVEALAEAMGYVLKMRSPEISWDVAVPVPKSPGKPFHPVALLTEELGKLTRTPAAAVMELDSSYESGLGMSEMEKFNNMRGKVKVARPDVIEGKSILLVDDIMTTQGVAHWCTDALLNAGAVEVNVVIAGRSVDMRHLQFIGYGGPY